MFCLWYIYIYIILNYRLKFWERPGRWEHHQKRVWVLRPEVAWIGCSVLSAFRLKNPLKVQHAFNIWSVYWHLKWIIKDLQVFGARTVLRHAGRHLETRYHSVVDLFTRHYAMRWLIIAGWTSWGVLDSSSPCNSYRPHLENSVDY